MDQQRHRLTLKSTHLIGGLIFSLSLFIFLASPVHQVTESEYSLLVSQSLLEYRSFKLDQYSIPRLEAVRREDYAENGDITQLEWSHNHIYYFFPPGSSVLSVPFVALLRMIGLSVTNADGSLNRDHETQVQVILAAFLMAVLSVVFFYTAQILLPLRWSVLVALSGALGTQIWSTASRALWTDTWGIFLLGLVVYMLLAQEVGRARICPVGLASLLAWTYFVRPTNAVHIIAITVYLAVYYRHLLVRYIITGALWLVLFVTYSWYNFGNLLPSYYAATRLKFEVFFVAFAGNLISPARGLLVYVPVLLFVAYLLLRYWNQVKSRRLVALSCAIVLGHLVAISGFTHWWGGHGFGPRFSTGLVPWFVLLAVLGIKAMLASQEKQSMRLSSIGRLAQAASGAVLLSASVFINARGAMSPDTWTWNTWPSSIDAQPQRLWNWRNPQFLAGLLPPPLTHDFPTVASGTRVDFGAADADQFIWYGWSSNHESGFRWSDGHEAAIVFALPVISENLVLCLRMAPFLVAGKITEQRIPIRLNGYHVSTLRLKNDAADIFVVELPKDLLRQKNVVKFELPDAASPKAMRGEADRRVLGVRVEWIELKSQTSGQP
jgi:hypothetical protein